MWQSAGCSAWGVYSAGGEPVASELVGRGVGGHAYGAAGKGSNPGSRYCGSCSIWPLLVWPPAS